MYALGEVSDTSDGVALHRPQDKDKPFMLSVKSEDELVAAGESGAKTGKIVGIGLLAVGGAVTLFGFIKLVTS